MKIRTITQELTKCLKEQGYCWQDFWVIDNEIDDNNISYASILLEVVELLNENFEVI